MKSKYKDYLKCSRCGLMVYKNITKNSREKIILNFSRNFREGRSLGTTRRVSYVLHTSLVLGQNDSGNNF
jgi:hypothetical protein